LDKRREARGGDHAASYVGGAKHSIASFAKIAQRSCLASAKRMIERTADRFGRTTSKMRLKRMPQLSRCVALPTQMAVQRRPE
jgi:hypothetical protein